MPAESVNMSVNIAGVTFKNPVTVASGTFGSGMEYSEYVDLNRLGAVTTKGVANVPWPGNPTPRIAETYGGMINAIGLQNPGLDTFLTRDIPFLKKYDTKIIAHSSMCDMLHPSNSILLGTSCQITRFAHCPRVYAGRET